MRDSISKILKKNALLKTFTNYSSITINSDHHQMFWWDLIFRTLGCFCGRFHNRLPLTFTSRGQEWAGGANKEQPAPGRRDLAPAAPGHHEPGVPGHSGRDLGSDLVGSSEKVQVSRGYTGYTSQEIFNSEQTAMQCPYFYIVMPGLRPKAIMSLCDQENGKRQVSLDGLDVFYYTASYRPGAGLGFSARWVWCFIFIFIIFFDHLKFHLLLTTIPIWVGNLLSRGNLIVFTLLDPLQFQRV